MNKDLGLDAATYGLAAGAFFWGYFLFEVPSNMILEKVGARMWIARIMVSWGLLSGATAFCVGPWSFLTMRFLLGLAEAGLFPGMILFFTYWFPDWHRARIVAGFTVALPVGGGGRLAGFDCVAQPERARRIGGLEMDVHRRSDADGAGRPVLLLCRHRSSGRGQVAQRRGAQLADRYARRPSARLIESKRKMSVWQSFWDPKVLLLTLNYFGIVGASLGMLLFLPQMVKTAGPHQYAGRLGEHDPVHLRRV